MGNPSGGALAVAEPVRQASDDLVHVVCCDPNRALCGTDVTNEPWTAPEDETTCSVCDLIDEEPCPACGADWEDGDTDA